MLRISHAFTLDKVIRYNFLLVIRYSFVPSRKEGQFCACTAVKLYRYSVNAREKENFCIGSQVIRYSVNAASGRQADEVKASCFFDKKLLLRGNPG